MKKFLIFFFFFLISSLLFSQGDYDYKTNKYTGKQDMVLKKSAIMPIKDTLKLIMNSNTFKSWNNGFFQYLQSTKPVCFIPNKSLSSPYGVWENEITFMDSVAGGSGINIENKKVGNFYGSHVHFINGEGEAYISLDHYHRSLQLTSYSGQIDNIYNVNKNLNYWRIREGALSGRTTIMSDSAGNIGIGSFRDGYYYDKYTLAQARLHITKQPHNLATDLLKLEGDLDLTLDSTVKFTNTGKFTQYMSGDSIQIYHDGTFGRIETSGYTFINGQVGVYIGNGGSDQMNVFPTHIQSNVKHRFCTTAGITASTTQSQGQMALVNQINEVSIVANANDVVTMPAAEIGLRIIVINNGANTLKIFPASGDNLGAGVDASVILAAGSNVEYVAYNTTNWEQL